MGSTKRSRHFLATIHPSTQLLNPPPPRHPSPPRPGYAILRKRYDSNDPTELTHVSAIQIYHSLQAVQEGLASFVSENWQESTQYCVGGLEDLHGYEMSRDGVVYEGEVEIERALVVDWWEGVWV